MKSIALVLSLFFLVSPTTATEEICLSSNHQSFTLPDKNYFQIESEGHYVLLETYEETEGEDPDKIIVFLLDLKTMETKELVNEPVPDTKAGNYFFLKYGFSKDGSLVWFYNSLDHTLKIWNLPEVSIKASILFTEGHVLDMKMKKDGFTLGSFEIIWPLPETIEELPGMEFFNYFNAKAKGISRTVNLKTLHQTQKVLPEIGTKFFCYGINIFEDHFFFTDKDGSLYQISLTTEEEPIKIFDSIEGFTFFNESFLKKNYKLSNDLFTMLKNIRQIYSHRNCSFNLPDLSLVLIPNPKGDGYILRVPKEGKEFLLPSSAFPDVSVQKSVSSPRYYTENFNISNLREYNDASPRYYTENSENFKSSLNEKGMTGYTPLEDLESPPFLKELELRKTHSRSIIEANNSKFHPWKRRKIKGTPKGFFNLPSVVHRRHSQTYEEYRKMASLYEEEAERLEERADDLYEEADRLSEKGLYEEADELAEKAYDLYEEADELMEKADDLSEAEEDFKNTLNYLWSYWSYIKYPFIINPYHDRGKMKIYHIPNEQFQTIHTGYTQQFLTDGRFSFETQEVSEEQLVLQAWMHPFDPDHRTFLFEWNKEEVCKFSIYEENNLAFVHTVQGDFFVFNLETGQVVRHFVEDCFFNIRPFSPTKFLFYAVDENRDTNKKIKIKTFSEQCVEPTQTNLDDIQSILIHLEQAENPTENSYFSLLIEALEQEEAVKNYPKLVTKILWNVLLHSPSLYFSLTRHYSFLETLSPPDMDFNFKANKPYLDGLLSLLKLTASEARESRLSDWNFLRPLQPLLKLLPATERNLYMEKITISLTNGATREIPLFRDVFQSKLYYTANGHIKELFGLTRKPVSDITLARRKREQTEGEETDDRDRNRVEIRRRGRRGRRGIRANQNDQYNQYGEKIRSRKGTFNQPDFIENQEEETLNAFTTVILASDPIEGYPSVPTDFGIHYAVVKEAGREIEKSEPGTILLDKAVQWKVLKGQSYRAQIKVSVKQERGIRELTLSSSPDYSAVWQDRRMVGVVIVGSSLRGFTRTLLEQYFSYFKEQGFQFSGAETEDLKGFLLERIQNCEIDYFLKESHSGGDERNLFRIDKKNHIIRGVFVDDEGREEVIYLIFPQVFQEKAGLKTYLLSYEELRQAIDLRKSNNCGQITYFSTGCWSDRKALYEVEAINSPLFLNIPSIDYSGTFQNNEKNAIRALLNSYRQGLNFDGFREALINKDPYIFPDEPQYQERIFDRIQIPLDIHISLERKDEKTWKKVAPDEAL